MPDSTTAPLLQVENLKKYYPVKGGLFGRTVGNFRAVDGISFTLQRGETIGLVGESGCGKSTAGKAILRLVEPTAGRVSLNGIDVAKLSAKQLHARRKNMQVVFQDPYSSLNPKIKAGTIVEEPFINYGLFDPAERRKRVAELFARVGLRASDMAKYPHEFSGGQRQRIGIARALALSPDLIIADEPVSALDVSVQAQIINLFVDLQEEFGLAYLFIAHDLGVVRHISDRVAVMYLGKIVEMAPTKDLFREPLHPYTQALLAAAPIPDPKQRVKRVLLKGDVPSPLAPPSGCRFHTRCPVASNRCRVEEPELVSRSKDGQAVACHLYDA